MNVVAVPSIVIGSGGTLTISGPSSAQVVINIGSVATPGVLTLSLSANVLLSGGITPDRVVFNVLGGGGQFVQLGNTITFNGTILAPQQGLVLIDGATAQPTIINGALLFGLSVSIGNNVNINFYPLAQIVQPVALNAVATVDVMQLPAPVRVTGQQTEADTEFKEPVIPELAPATNQLSPLAETTSFSTPAAVVLAAPTNQATQDPMMTGLAFAALGDGDNLAPPDTQVAAGQNVIVEMVNVTGAVYDKASGKRLNTFSLDKMFGNTNTGTDPRVMYDAGSKHFFGAYELRTARGDDIRLGVAPDPQMVNGSLQFSWTIFDVKSNKSDTCFDQPKLGYRNENPSSQS